ncbi:MAG: ATP-binding protein [Planctomycetota bacterium]
MLSRALEPICRDPAFGRQMRFITGPRQCGKTTLARAILKKDGDTSLYYNWDTREVRDRYRQNPMFFTGDSHRNAAPSGSRHPWVVFDEIHKMPKWKNILKGQFDAAEDRFRFIVTGSARLDLFRKSGDSLAGRYFLFHLFPLTLRELPGAAAPAPPRAVPPALEWVLQRLDGSVNRQEAMESLLACGGFPEPFLKADARFHRKWQAAHIDRVVREDLRDLTRIPELENIATLIRLLPGRVGSPLSLNALREDLEVSHTAVRTYVRALELILTVFLLRPFHKSLARAIRKERKVYLFDWSLVGDPALRFENYAALELKARVEMWNDAGIGEFDLGYVRNRDGRETDFLITAKGNPWLLLEAKLTDRPVESHHIRHARALGDIPFVQLTAEPGIALQEGRRVFRVSASRFFADNEG